MIYCLKWICNKNVYFVIDFLSQELSAIRGSDCVSLAYLALIAKLFIRM